MKAPPEGLDEEARSAAQRLIEACSEPTRRIAVAESLTGGGLSMAIATAPGAGEVFQGGIVAYQSGVKFSALGVRPGPVVTADAAEQMATGAAERLGADLGIAVTGVAGPDTQEGMPVGTVYVAASLSGSVTSRRGRFDGPPEEVRAAAVRFALDLANAVVTAGERPVAGR